MSERECGCPPWVVQCAHFDGKALWLNDQTSAAKGIAETSCPVKWLEVGADTYGVYLGEVDRCSCGQHGGLRTGMWQPAQTLTLDDARAEFRRRSELLRTGA